ncbi:hypothetical protein Sked_32790 [Sanguibacter keddieii DSM 10542]|uniref:Uncharacterized protein n=1 Tax=Sanguibacter keddieii (strain ATCC 51767 / DSM 10542 / NCFB 3025 / ST-74) TaxID=446469 RepID=D1BDV3_SANKS|nr:hypothetical protein [Sanguibacter keddieii]ACZ23174.1 hypothetical protein Sked_32790 [Sanguibacter keddieii DSM 10542]
MSRTLRDDLGSLASLGSSGIDADASADRVLATVRARRRRRPVLVAAATAACLAVTGTGAVAAFQLLRDDPAPVALPDDPRGQSIRTLCGQPAPDYLEATASPSIVYSFAADRPAAVADLDGSDLAAGPLEEHLFAATEPLPSLYVNARGSEDERSVVGPTGFVVVKDGVVVATPPGGPGAWSSTQATLDPDGVAMLTSWGVQACGQVTSGDSDGSYEPGTYTVYGVTRVADPDAPRTATGPDVGDPGLVVGPPLSMTLVDPGDGGVVRYFGDAPRTAAVVGVTDPGTLVGRDGAVLDEATASLDWPEDVTPALWAGTATAQSVVWFSPVQGFGAADQGVQTDAAVVLAAARTSLEHIGYAPGEHLLQVSCQPAAAEALAGVSPTDDLTMTFGYGVAFDSAEDAARFVDLFSSAFGYTPVQVDGEAACR